eukprot:2293874-Pyramimonas_sp.AAC.1
MAESVLCAARAGDKDTGVSLNKLYQAWANKAERELRGLYQKTLPRMGCRGEVPKTWRVDIHKRDHRPCRHPPLFIFKWLAHAFRAWRQDKRPH